MSQPMFEALYGTHQSGSHATVTKQLSRVCQPCANQLIAQIAKGSHCHESNIGLPVKCEHIDFYSGPNSGCSEFAADDEAPCTKLATTAVEYKDQYPDQDNKSGLATDKLCAGHAAEFVIDLNAVGTYHHETYLQSHASYTIPFGSHASDSINLDRI